MNPVIIMDPRGPTQPWWRPSASWGWRPCTRRRAGPGCSAPGCAGLARGPGRGHRADRAVRAGDNLMLHAALEQARPGDLVVLTTTSPSSDGFVGDLIVTSLAARGVTGLVTTTGVRDIAEITAAAFPVWSQHRFSAQGTLKAAAGCVNVPVVIGGVVVRPGDAVVADADGVACVPRELAAQVAADGQRRVQREDEARAALRGGELSLDRYGLRPVLAQLGVRYVQAGAPEDPR